MTSLSRPPTMVSDRREIRERVQQIVGDAETVTNVYFTDFVIQ